MRLRPVSLALAVTLIFASLSALPAHAAAPTVINASSESLYPDSGSITTGARAGADGRTPVILRGTGFTGATVTVGGMAVTDLVVVSDARISFVAPSHPHNTKQNLVVTNSDGSVTMTDFLHYYNRPVLVSPPAITGDIDRGQVLTVTPASWQGGTVNVTSWGLVGCSEPHATVQTLLRVPACNKPFTGAASVNPTSVTIDETHFCTHLAIRDDSNLAGVHDHQTSATTPLVLPQSAPFATCYFPNGASGSAPATGSSDSPVAANRGSLNLTGQVFAGWSSEPDGTGTFYATGATLPSDGNVLLYAQFATREIYQLAEINPGPSHSSIFWMSELGGKLYINATHPDTGRELFVYDGQTVELVRDLNPGSADGLYQGGFLVNTGTEIYFQATNGVTGFELYKFNGTEISLVADIDPRDAASTSYFDNMIVSSNPGSDGRAVWLSDKLFFEARYPSAQGYVYDPADSSLKTFTQYFGSVPQAGFRNPHVAGGTLFYAAGNGPSAAIYSTSGAAASAPVEVPGTVGTRPRTIGSIGIHVLYAGTPNISGNAQFDQEDLELYRFASNNLAAGASLLQDINTFGNPTTPAGSFPGPFTSYQSKLWFPASSGAASITGNRELYSYNGATVTLEHDIWPGAAAGESGWPQELRVIGSELFFSANGSGTGRELWKISNGVLSMLEDSMPGSASSVSGSAHITPFGGQVVFSIQKGDTGLELYAYGPKPPGHQVATYNHPYTISYDANGGSGSETQTAPSGSVTLDTGAGFSNSDKVLLGWDPSASATTPSYSVGSSFTLTANVTLYAVWADPETFTITYNPNGGSGADSVTQVGGSVTLDSGTGFSFTGRTLLGWDTSQTATSPAFALGSSFTLSADVTLYAIWSAEAATPPAPQDPPITQDPPTIPNPPTTQNPPEAQAPGSNQPPAGSDGSPSINLPAGPRQGIAGGELEFTGEGLDEVTKAEVGKKDAPILGQEPTKITLELPELNPGLHNLTLTSSFGTLELVNAVRIIFGTAIITPEAMDQFSAWTKLNRSKTKVQVFAKNPVGAGKVQLMLNGREIAWLRAVDNTDPKLRFANGAHYLVRTIELAEGKNAIEIFVDGERVRRVAYTG